MVCESSNSYLFQNRAVNNFEKVLALEHLKVKIDVVLVFVDLLQFRQLRCLYASEDGYLLA